MRRIFIDSNIWLTGLDYRDPAKAERAIQCVGAIASPDQVVISSQVVNEVAATLVRKFQFEPAAAATELLFLKKAEFCSAHFGDAESSLALMTRYSISFWDGLIVAAALRASCDELLTEDLQHNQIIDGLRVRNPFAST